MKKIATLLMIVLFLAGCASPNQDIINYRTKGMKFTGNADQQEAMSAKCKLTIDNEEYPPLLMFGSAAGAVAWGSQKKYDYQDCMAEKGFICIEDCAYEAKK